jgi:hypothetical protein
VPTASGQMQLQDYDAALVARGFEGYQPAERIQMINHGYRYIARKYPWAWENSNVVLPMNPGDGTLIVAGATPLGASNIDEIYITTNPYRRKLLVMDQNVFEKKWLPLDLTDPSTQGVPEWYYVWAHTIYILPPPSSLMQILVYFDGYLPDMVNMTDTPVTPQILDEVILDAALVRAHRRAHELDLAADAQNRIDEAVMDMLQDDVWVMAERQERVIPDNQWL